MIQFTAPENRIIRVNDRVTEKMTTKVTIKEQELLSLLAEDPGYTMLQLPNAWLSAGNQLLCG